MYDQVMIDRERRPGETSAVNAAFVMLAMDSDAAWPVRYLLEEEGFRVKAVDTPTHLLQRVLLDQPDLVVLDTVHLNTPIVTLCDTLHRLTEAPSVLVLLSTKDLQQMFRVLDHGADDCLVAPFNPDDILTRVRVVLRRRQRFQHGRLTYADLEILTGTRQVLIRQAHVQLTPLEFNLLVALARRPGIVISREQLAHTVWGADWVGDCRVVDSHICRLRRKLRDSGFRQCAIRSIRSIGYVFQPESKLS
jgi:DNA-binding response OmpR family regulator